jgi:hypothetical protein
MRTFAGGKPGAVVVLAGNCLHPCFGSEWSTWKYFWQDGDTYDAGLQDTSKFQGENMSSLGRGVLLTASLSEANEESESSSSLRNGTAVIGSV